ncbi:tetratricopeptide repeat protein [uncultured Celeribacter sp.]|uniref:tetratricopeptide repeat protein n=1 Tax=uncultured Celeribacter sp. TaxID=1303376 RepID=UPI00374A8873
MPLGAAFCLFFLTACQDGGLKPLKDAGAVAPPGLDATEESVDGLTVGHRLMASGEYELALKAYYRAAAHQGMTVDTLSALGSAKLRLGRLGQSEQDLRRAIELDDTFVPAWNNLGVVLMERGEFGEAERVFRTAFALDSGHSAEIRENLRLALAKLENPEYSETYESNFTLVRRGTGEYLILAR